MSEFNDPKDTPEPQESAATGGDPTPQPAPAETTPQPQAETQQNQAAPPAVPATSGGLTTNQWLMFLHLSQLANFIAPVVGIAAPIIIWQIKKSEIPGMDQHGKMVANFCILMAAISVVGIILTVVTCGFLGVVVFPILAVIGLVWMVFSVIGGIKANDGVFWEYPGTIDFIK